MIVKQRAAILLAGTVLGASLLGAATALADDAQSQQQLQNQINALQQQLQTLQNQVTQTKQQAQAAETAVQNLPGLYNQAPAGSSSSPMVFKGPSWLPTGVHVSLAGSFIAAEGVWRQRNELSSGASDPAFGSLPFSNTPLYYENEVRFSAQQSRIALAVTGDIDPAQHLKAYYESDWLGAGVTANSRESNSYNLRIRQAFFEYDSDNYHFHVVAGQQWSLLTQERVGMLPQFENTPLTIDAQYVVGFNWARQPGLRIVEDWNKIAWFGISVESPQSAIGGTLPASGAAYPFVVNAANTCNNGGLLNDTTYCSNNSAPDIVEKVALDPGWGHYEAFGVERLYSAAVSPFVSAVTPAAWSNTNTFGWDAGGSVLLPVVPKILDLQASVMYGNGGGRYGSSQLSDITYGATGSMAPLPYLSVLVGGVLHPIPGLDIYAYAGQEQVNANSFGAGAGAGGYGNPLFVNNGCALANPAYAGSTSSSVVGTASFNSAIAGSTCTANVQKTQEITVGFWDDIYKGDVGRVRLGMQYEYVRLTAFGSGCPAAGAAACTAGPISTPNAGLNPNNNIFFVSLRYYPFN